jgi:hypothetical protein
MEQRRQARDDHSMVSWLSCAAVAVGVAFACTACSREDSAAPKTKSGSGPIGYAAGGGGGGGSMLAGGSSSGGGAGDSTPLGEGGVGGGSGRALVRPSEAWTELTRKFRSGGPLGPEDDTYSQTTVDVPQDLTSTQAMSDGAPLAADPNGLGTQLGPLDQTPDVSAAPLPSTAWAGLGLIVGLMGVLLWRKRGRLERATVEVRSANSKTHQTGPQ